MERLDAYWRTIATRVRKPASLHHLPTRSRLSDEWDWSSNKRRGWELDEDYQKFYDRWREGDAPNFLQANTLQGFPCILDFGKGEAPFLNTVNFGENRIIVTKAYVEMFRRILYLRAVGQGGAGVVLTGQPGAGVSLG